MKPLRFILTGTAVLIACITLTGTALAMTPSQSAPTVTGNSPNLSNHFLDGTFIRWEPKGILVTSVGRFDTSNIFVDDRKHTRDADTAPATAAQVRLEFIGKTLTRVVIY